MQIIENKLYLGGVSAEKLIEKYGSPLYVYKESTILERFQTLHDAISYSHKKILYAIKANPNPYIAKLLREKKCGVDAVSPGEIELALHAGFKNENILFTGNNMTETEMDFAVQKGVLLNIDSLSRMEKFGKKYPEKSICIRVNPEVIAGHHEHVITAGPKSKFGINYNQIEEIKKILQKYKLNLIGVHSHIGSGILDPNKFLLAMEVTCKIAREFDSLKFIDFGGGIGIPYKPEEKAINLQDFGKKVSAFFEKFCTEYGKKLTLILEPGRFLVAESGFLLTQVNTLKQNGERKFAGTDSGFNQLIRPTMYGSYHPIYNASNMQGKMEKIDICGNICESGDLFARDREISKIKEGDVLAIAHTGAYGFAMASTYNFRPLPAEIIIRNKKSRLIRKRQSITELLKDYI